VDISPVTESVQDAGLSWIASQHGLDCTESISLDFTTFTPAIHYPSGFLPSGTHLSRITDPNPFVRKYGLHSGTTDEVQTVTEGSSGLTSFTLTYSGQTTGSIAAAATAATVQLALEALSNIAPGDITVAGSTGGPYTVTFATLYTNGNASSGQYAGTNVAQMTATPTGGSGTVTIATTTAGGQDGSSDGRGVLGGFLYGTVRAPKLATTPVAAALFWHGVVDPTKLPFQVDGNAWADVEQRIRRRS
jgi:hypothetical protein